MTTTTPLPKRSRRTLTPRKPEANPESATLHGTLSIASETLSAHRIAQKRSNVSNVAAGATVASVAFLWAWGPLWTLVTVVTLGWWCVELNGLIRALRALARLEAVLARRTGL